MLSEGDDAGFENPVASTLASNFRLRDARCPAPHARIVLPLESLLVRPSMAFLQLEVQRPRALRIRPFVIGAHVELARQAEVRRGPQVFGSVIEQYTILGVEDTATAPRPTARPEAQRGEIRRTADGSPLLEGTAMGFHAVDESSSRRRKIAVMLVHATLDPLASVKLVGVRMPQDGQHLLAGSATQYQHARRLAGHYAGDARCWRPGDVDHAAMLHVSAGPLALPVCGHHMPIYGPSPHGTA